MDFFWWFYPIISTFCYDDVTITCDFIVQSNLWISGHVTQNPGQTSKYWTAITPSFSDYTNARKIAGNFMINL